MSKVQDRPKGSILLSYGRPFPRSLHKLLQCFGDKKKSALWTFCRETRSDRPKRRTSKQIQTAIAMMTICSEDWKGGNDGGRELHEKKKSLSRWKMKLVAAPCGEARQRSVQMEAIEMKWVGRGLYPQPAPQESTMCWTWALRRRLQLPLARARTLSQASGPHGTSSVFLRVSRPPSPVPRLARPQPGSLDDDGGGDGEHGGERERACVDAMVGSMPRLQSPLELGRAATVDIPDRFSSHFIYPFHLSISLSLEAAKRDTPAAAHTTLEPALLSFPISASHDDQRNTSADPTVSTRKALTARKQDREYFTG